MLDRDGSDGERLGARLKARAEYKHVSPQTMAKACSVTDKAVYGWFTTGRVAKKHLAILAGLLDWTVEDIVSDDAERTRRSAEEGRKDWSHEAQQLATLFDMLDPAKRRAAWPFLVRMLAQTTPVLNLFLRFPVRDDQAEQKRRHPAKT